MLPRLTIFPGDRNGIGPELCARLLADDEAIADTAIEVLGDPAVLSEGARVAGVRLRQEKFATLEFLPVPAIATTPGRVSAEAGRECLAALSYGAKRVQSGEADGFVFAPLNKAAMHLGGLRQEDELRYLATEIGFAGHVGELNELDGLWTTRVTSHVPIKDVAAGITTEAVLQSTRFAHETLRQAGNRRPRIAVAALNPHAGDGGNFGREEIDVIEPAVAAARDEGIAAEGPFPADTVFVRARAGDFDCVVTMYHDQGQIAMKLMGFGRGVTVLGGLPLPVATCGHGTGYDIAGQGRARPDALKNAVAICRAMAASRLGAAGGIRA